MIYISDIAAFEYVGAEVTSFFVSKPFTNKITFVSLHNLTLRHFSTIYSNSGLDVYPRRFSPQFMTKTSRNSLLVSATDAVFEMQIDNREIYSVIWPPPDISTRSAQEEQSGTNWMLQTESLNTVHVVRPGLLVAIKGYADLFVLTEETKSMIRIIYITDMTIYRLCNDGRPTTTAPNCPVHSVYSLLVSNVNCTLLMLLEQWTAFKWQPWIIKVSATHTILRIYFY